MKNRRSFTGWLGAAIFGALVTGIGHAAIADEFPSRPIRILVNTGPGGLIDVTVRLLAESLSENLGQPVIVENKAGGDGIVGILAAKGAAPDGYTLLATSGTIAIQTAVKIDPGYDIAADFAPVGSIMQAPLILMEGAAGPDSTFDEFMTRAKASPTEVSYASAGVGSGTHLPAAILFKEANLDILHIPYKGNGPAMPDVMSGRVDVIFEAYSSGGGKLKDGTLKGLAVTSAERMPSLPDIPTIAEFGLSRVRVLHLRGASGAGRHAARGRRPAVRGAEAHAGGGRCHRTVPRGRRRTPGHGASRVSHLPAR